MTGIEEESSPNNTRNLMTPGFLCERLSSVFHPVDLGFQDIAPESILATTNTFDMPPSVPKSRAKHFKQDDDI